MNKKIIISFIIVFILINAFLNLHSFADSAVSFTGRDLNSPLPAWVATPIKIIVTSCQVIATGAFTIILAINGIQYFTATSAASEKAANRERVRMILIYGVIVILGMNLIIYILDLK